MDLLVIDYLLQMVKLTAKLQSGPASCVDSEDECALCNANGLASCLVFDLFWQILCFAVMSSPHLRFMFQA